MAVKTRNSAKKSKASKGASSSLSSKRRSSRRNISHRAEAEDDTSIVSDDTAVSSPLNNNILISPRLDEFSERTWWMVDMFEQDDEEEGNATTQGATALVKRCIRVYGWDLQKTRKVLSAYKQFLTLKKQYQDWDATLLSPSLLVDQMWHQHILDVVNYSHDMMLLCGRVVGHNPDGASDGKKKAERDATTRNALEQRFPNKYDKEIWGVALLKVGEDSEAFPTESISIRIRGMDGTEIAYKIKRTSKIGTMFNLYAQHKGVCLSNIRFMLRGEYIDDQATPMIMGLEDDDQIDAFLAQSGC